MEDEDFGRSEEDDSDFEGEGVEDYLPRADPEPEVMEEDEEPIDFEDIVSDDSSSLVMRVLLSL